MISNSFPGSIALLYVTHMTMRKLIVLWIVKIWPLELRPEPDMVEELVPELKPDYASTLKSLFGG